MKNFNEIYQEIVKLSKNELEQQRKPIFRKAIIATLFIIVVELTICITAIISINISDFFIMVITSMIVIFVVALIYISNLYKDYCKIYKEQVVKKLIHCYDKNLKYEYEKGISEEIYTQAFKEKYTSYTSEDLIVGNIDGYKISMAEVRTKKVKKRHTITVFQGLFGVIEIRNQYHGTIKIHSNRGAYQQEQQIEMDSGEFEEYFDVIAEDKIQAMQLLTSDIMNKMLEFIKSSNIKFELTIKNNQFFIRFKTGSMFEGSILNSAVDFNALKKVYDVIHFTFDITRAMVKVTDETDL